MKLRARFENGKSTTATEPTPAAVKPTTDVAVSPAARSVALAHHLARLIEKGLIADYTQAARMLGVSQPRLTHLMSLLLLAPAIQEGILLGTIAPGDKTLRRVARIADWRAQMSALSL